MQNINKFELVALMKQYYIETNQGDNNVCKTKKEIEEILNLFIDVVKEELSKGNKINLRNFGTFEVVERAERIGRNPKTGEDAKIPACKVPKFKPGEDFKNCVNR